MSDSPKFIQWHASSWQDAVDLSRSMYGWIYRGQESTKWRLTPSLERIAKSYDCPQITLQEREEEIINKFKRQAHQYLTHLPDKEKNLEWLSLIQHHGGPTRLLDFTRSFYIGTFYALENATGQAVLWAINRSILDTKLLSVQQSNTQNIRKTAKEKVEQCLESPRVNFSDTPNVIAVKPWRLNQRMIIQQGWFLFPTSLDTTFEHNLCSTFGILDRKLPEKTDAKSVEELKQIIAEPTSNLALVKMIFSKDIHLKAMRDLQQMNITAATLFPGLDGFARSLKLPLRIFDDIERNGNESIS